MLRFEKSFNGFESVGNAWAFLELCCKACGVEMENTRAEIEGMPNGRELLSNKHMDQKLYQNTVRESDYLLPIEKIICSISQNSLNRKYHVWIQRKHVWNLFLIICILIRDISG